MNSIEEDRSAPSTDFLITAYGAMPGDAADNRAAIQAAVDACAHAGGGRVVVPPGTWITGSVRLLSHVELHLAPGAILSASSTEAAFPVLAETLNLPLVIRALIWADGAEDIAITGRGVLYGNGDSPLWGEEAAQTFFRPALVFLRDCRGVLLRDTRLHYSQYWTCHLLRCSDVVIDAIDIRTHRGRINADGIDPDGCRDVRISNCFIDSTDDALCFKSTEGDPCEDIVVTNCLLASRCAAIKLGTESIGPIRRIHISNCIIRESAAGIAFYQKDGGGFHSVTISNISVQCHGDYPILFDSSRRWRNQERVGEIRSVLIENARCHGPGRMLLRGHPDAPLRDITLRSVSFAVTGPFNPGGGRAPTGSRRSERDPSHADDSHRQFQALITNVIGLKMDNFSVADSRADGCGDRGVAYIRACRDVSGDWSAANAALPAGEPVLVEDSSGIKLAGI